MIRRGGGPLAHPHSLSVASAVSATLMRHTGGIMMQTVILTGFVVMAIGAILFVVPRVLPLRGRTARSLTRLAVAAWLLAILLIVATAAIGLIGHALLYA